MESLNLHVKDGICINLQLRSLFYICRKPLFIGLLCGFHGVQEAGIFLNGAGKTTLAGKLALFLKTKKNESINPKFD